jgi:hypothetical protein
VVYFILDFHKNTSINTSSNPCVLCVLPVPHSLTTSF